MSIYYLLLSGAMCQVHVSYLHILWYSSALTAIIDSKYRTR